MSCTTLFSLSNEFHERSSTMADVSKKCKVKVWNDTERKIEINETDAGSIVLKDRGALEFAGVSTEITVS